MAARSCDERSIAPTSVAEQKSHHSDAELAELIDRWPALLGKTRQSAAGTNQNIAIPGFAAAVSRRQRRLFRFTEVQEVLP